MEKIDLKTENGLVSIGGLTSHRFFVDSYQRGYRWTKDEVNDLLNDILEFWYNPKEQKFYCLQPVVVRWREAEKDWELIDGQQRLTTIYLILKILQNPLFTINYKTRNENLHFLHLLNETVTAQEWKLYVEANPGHDHIDNYHLFTAYKTISVFFKGKEEYKKNFLGTLTERTKVIWYEVDKEKEPLRELTDSRTVFTRINGGKIALTQAELLKAWFIEKAGAEGKRVAQKWEEMERQLRVPEFRYFLTGTSGDSAPNAINVLLEDLASAREPLDKANIFRKLTTNFEGKMKPIAFADVENLFDATWLWYSDTELYNLVGWLRTVSYNRLTTIASWAKETKTGLKDSIKTELRKKVADAFNGPLNYRENKDEIKDVLFSFNILAYSGQSLVERFPFHHYKTIPWNIEHIHALATGSPETHTTMETWLNDYQDFLKTVSDKEREETIKRLLERIETLTKEVKADKMGEIKKFESEFLEIQKLVLQELGEEGSPDSIENLALLNESINKSIKNSPFVKKRKAIIEAANSGTFLPPATLRVFLKFYTPGNVNSLIWGKADRDGYYEAMKSTFEKFGITAKQSQK